MERLEVHVAALAGAAMASEVPTRHDAGRDCLASKGGKSALLFPPYSAVVPKHGAASSCPRDEP